MALITLEMTLVALHEEPYYPRRVDLAAETGSTETRWYAMFSTDSFNDANYVRLQLGSLEEAQKLKLGETYRITVTKKTG